MAAGKPGGRQARGGERNSCRAGQDDQEGAGDQGQVEMGIGRDWRGEGGRGIGGFVFVGDAATGSGRVAAGARSGGGLEAAIGGDGGFRADETKAQQQGEEESSDDGGSVGHDR